MGGEIVEIDWDGWGLRDMCGGEGLDRSIGMLKRAQIMVVLVDGFEHGGYTRFVQAACAGRD